LGGTLLPQKSNSTQDQAMNKTTYLKMDLIAEETNQNLTRQVTSRWLSGFMIAVMACPLGFWLGILMAGCVR
jgi:hypothetical protein